MTTGSQLPGMIWEQLLDDGGRADVHLYRDEQSMRRFAVKILRNPTSPLHGMDREARALGAVCGHPAVVRLFATGVSATGEEYLVMEHCPTTDFAYRVKSQPMTIPGVLDIAIRLCSGIEALQWAGFVHGDIRPENILLTSENYPVLSGFGRATPAGSGSPQREPRLFCIPPEKLADIDHAEPEQDIYALSATIWTLLSGRAPFESPDGDNSPQSVTKRTLAGSFTAMTRTDVPPQLLQILRQGMQLDPQARPASALGMAHQLQQVQRSIGQTVTPARVQFDAKPVRNLVASEPLRDIEESATPVTVIKSKAWLEPPDSVSEVVDARIATDAATPTDAATSTDAATPTDAAAVGDIAVAGAGVKGVIVAGTTGTKAAASATTTDRAVVTAPVEDAEAPVPQITTIAHPAPPKPAKPQVVLGKPDTPSETAAAKDAYAADNVVENVANIEAVVIANATIATDGHTATNIEDAARDRDATAQSETPPPRRSRGKKPAPRPARGKTSSRKTTHSQTLASPATPVEPLAAPPASAVSNKSPAPQFAPVEPPEPRVAPVPQIASVTPPVPQIAPGKPLAPQITPAASTAPVEPPIQRTPSAASGAPQTASDAPQTTPGIYLASQTSPITSPAKAPFFEPSVEQNQQLLAPTSSATPNSPTPSPAIESGRAETTFQSIPDRPGSSLRTGSAETGSTPATFSVAAPKIPDRITPAPTQPADFPNISPVFESQDLENYIDSVRQQTRPSPNAPTPLTPIPEPAHLPSSRSALHSPTPHNPTLRNRNLIQPDLTQPNMTPHSPTLGETQPPTLPNQPPTLPNQLPNLPNPEYREAAAKSRLSEFLRTILWAVVTALIVAGVVVAALLGGGHAISIQPDQNPIPPGNPIAPPPAPVSNLHGRLIEKSVYWSWEYVESNSIHFRYDLIYPNDVTSNLESRKYTAEQLVIAPGEYCISVTAVSISDGRMSEASKECVTAS